MIHPKEGMPLLSDNHLWNNFWREDYRWYLWILAISSATNTVKFPLLSPHIWFTRQHLRKETVMLQPSKNTKPYEVSDAQGTVEGSIIMFKFNQQRSLISQLSCHALAILMPNRALFHNAQVVSILRKWNTMNVSRPITGIVEGSSKLTYWYFSPNPHFLSAQRKRKR